MSAVRIHKKPGGVPTAHLTVTHDVLDSGADQVTAIVHAHDAFDMSEVVASLRFSPDEARDFARRLVDAADRAPTHATRPTPSEKDIASIDETIVAIATEERR